jgi:hypothetical protein
MSGNPVSTTPIAGKPSDNLYMTMDDVAANGYFNSFWGTANGGFSPGAGADWSIGSASIGYICGMNGNYRGIPDDDFAYFKGEVQTVYELDNKLSHNVEICIRYFASNGLISSCGYRKCEVNCSGRVNIFGRQYDGTCTKVCGYDVCKKLSIKEGPGVTAGGCESSSDTFNSDLSGKDCVTSFKTDADIGSAHLRARIYKPESTSDYICAVVDFKGITTDMVRKPYFDGTEYFTVPDLDKKGSTKKLCVSGTYNESSDSCQFGVDTNSSEPDVDVWRTAKIVKYASAPVYDFDYIDQHGIGPPDLHSLHVDSQTGLQVNQTIGRVNFNIKRYYETSDCIRHKSRISGPVFYAEPTIAESERLFFPQIQINRICSIAEGSNCNEVIEPNKEQETDFFKPAIEILWGKIDAQYPRSNIAGAISATNNKIIQINDASQEKSEDYTIFARNVGITTSDQITKIVFIKKENQGLQPKLCLYEKFGSGATLKETKIRCINRKKPKNASIVPKPTLAYNQLNYSAKFLKNSTSEHDTILDTSLRSGDFNFRSMINNPKNINDLKECMQIPGQGFPLCLKREECSILNNECVTNEKDLINARNTIPLDYSLIASKETVSNYCKKELLPRCNSKKGFDLTYSNQTLNTSTVQGVGFNAPEVNNHYGWFNEVCVISGLESLDTPVYVEELIPEGGSGSGIGKCNRFSPGSGVCPNCDNLTNCTKGPDCCKLFNPITSPENVNKRIATPRELGFCFTIDLYLNTCPAISYVDTINLSDPYYISPSSLDSPHRSHSLRFSASNHAEFDVAYEGNLGIKGRCVGFYKNKIESINPSANCLSSGWAISGEACTLYSCPARKLSINEADILGKYPPSYDTSMSDKGSLRGSNEGYANWDSRDIVNLNKINAESNSCITGYRKINSTPLKNPINAGSPALSSKISQFRSTLATDYISSLYGTIYDYQNGLNPQRKCNQIGKWEQVTNPCQRITCPPINIPAPVEAGSVNMNDYDLAVATISGINKKVIFSERSPFNPSNPGSPRKIKITTGLIQNSPIYFNLFVNSSTVSVDRNHDLIIKNTAGQDATLQANTTYIMEKIDAIGGSPAYWKIIPSPNDEVLKALWIKSGGAIFRDSAYAYRSSINLYTQEDLDEFDKHEITGECYAAMGFSQISSEPPKITCDSNGNWTRLKNVCGSACSEVSGVNANDISHGYSSWSEIRGIKVGESREVDSNGCFDPSYKKYSYPPLFDSEGVRKDFYNIATQFDTSDTFDAIISSVDGANFTVNNPVLAGVNLADSDDNENGTYYNFKVSNSGLSSSLVSSPYSYLNPLNVFYLFDDSQSLSISAPANNIWSKINFSSYGTPTFTDSKESKINCHSDYSKLVLASKCIGKSNCTLNLSDFETYDTLTCPAFSLGNGANGITTTNPDLGSSGGGGGGNVGGSGGDLTNAINVNGSSGSSYYDKSFHLSYPTLSDGSNKGLKVDLTSNTASQFDGGNGSVIIEESPDSSFSQTETTSYTNVGENTHNVELGALLRRAGSDDVYIRYVMIGGGGGGGGPGLTKGTNGASGTKMTGGVFIVKSGTTLKIHVGGGGKAGKTKCSRILSTLDPQLINPAIEILEPEKEINFVVKALRGIGSLFISEGWALTCSSTQHKVTTKYFKYCEWNGYNRCDYVCIEKTDFVRTDWLGNAVCTPTSQINTAFKSDDTCADTICFLNEGTGYNGRNVDGNSSSVSCDKAGYSGNVNYTCKAARDITCDMRGLVTVTGQYTYSPTSTFSWVKNCGLHGGETINATSNCTANTCKLSAGTGYDAISSVSGAGSITCKTGYRNGSTPPTYYCRSNGANVEATVSGTCELNYCRLSAGTGYDAINSVSGAGSITCKTGFINGSPHPTYTCAVNNLSSSATVSGSCIKQCTIPAGNGYAGATVVGSGTLTCAGTPYNITDTVAYSCSSAGVLSWTDQICNCATSYSRSGDVANTPCTANSCTLRAGTGYITDTTVYGSATSIFCNAPGYSGTITYSCATNLASINPSANNCTANYCASTATGNGYNSIAVTATATIPCNLAGYAGSVTATCATGTNVASVTGACTCAEGFYQTAPGEVCNPIKCTSSGASVGTANTNLPYTNSSYTPRRTVSCISPYSGNAEYTCTASTPPTSTTGIFAITTACYCIDGYRLVSGVCTANSCTSLASGNGYTIAQRVEASATISCNLTGYAGSVTATCATGTNVAGVTGACTCAEGYYQTAPGAVCNPITCDANGAGYSYKTGLSYTLGTSTSTFDCDEDYYGTVTYKCNGTGSLTRSATNIVSSCVKVTCPLPPNSDLTGASVNFAKIATNYGCGNGYRKILGLDLSSINPTYTCVKNVESDRQFNPSKLTTSNECIPIICTTGSGITYPFTDAKPREEPCVTDDTWGSEIFSCDSNGVISFSQYCNSVYCPVPANRNLFYERENFPYSGENFVDIYCNPGYYYEECPQGQTLNCGRPKFKCSKNSQAPANTQPGVLTLKGVCSRTRCLLPTTGQDALNSSIDGSMVDWNGPGNFINLNCGNGFYQINPSLPPKYSCFGNNQRTGTLSTLNPCLPITCSIGDQTGISAKNNLEFGNSKSINCDKPGFSGTLTYNCQIPTPLAAIGVLTIVNNNCTESSCTASANFRDTFTNFVSTSAQSGGLGGTILASNFLKGGQGGSASSDFVNGSGGGGGSASMIVINKRIIAIAGGGGGGGGGGNQENSNDAVSKKSIADLRTTLDSNIYGKYFIGEMQFNQIQNSDPARTSGIIKAQNVGNIFNLSIPTGMYVNDIIFSSYGNPTIDFSANNLKLKKGSSCHDTNSMAVAVSQCLSKKTCSFETNTGPTFLSSSCTAPNTNFGMIASYYFQEPTLFVNKSNSVPSNSQITDFTFKLKQYDSKTATFAPASDLVHNKVYSFYFYKSSNSWVKNEYTDDEYFISDPASNNANIIKVSFHRTNTSFSPTLKTGNYKRTMVRPANNSLSVGFIKIGKQYILRKSIDDTSWIVREFGDEEVSALNESDKKLPQRTCMTKELSSLGTVGILWSRPNTMCTNFCPGATLNLIKAGDDRVFDGSEKYDFTDSTSYYLVGDDRIGVGVTKHELSDGNYYTYWGNQSLNSWQIRKFKKTDKKIRNGRNLLINETSDSINSSNFRKNPGSDDRANKDYFILARKCDSSGQWEAPISLCSTEGNAGDPTKAPSNDNNSYFENIYDSEFGNNNNKKYVRQSGSSKYQSSCLTGFLPQTDSHIYFSTATNKVPAPIYQCTTKPGGKIDEVYFKKTDGYDCKKYCSVRDLDSNQNKKSDFKIKIPATLSEYYVRPSSDILDASSSSVSSGSLTVECQDGKFPRLIDKITTYDFGFAKFSFTVQVRSDQDADKPKITCVRNMSTGVLNWEKDPTYQCYDGRTCLYNSLTELDGIDIPRFLKDTKCVYTFDKVTYTTLKATAHGDITQYITTGETCPPPSKYYILKSSTPSYDAGNKDVWFTLNKYIKREHQTNGLAHGVEEKFGGTPQCGYVVSSYGASRECASFDRKYLKSYSCNDGTWVPIWNNSDADWHKSCNGKGDTCTFNDVKEEAVPSSAWLGWITSDKNDMFTRKYSLFPNPKGDCDTCIGDPPPPAKTPEQLAAEAQAAAEAAAALEAEKQRVMFGGVI